MCSMIACLVSSVCVFVCISFVDMMLLAEDELMSDCCSLLFNIIITMSTSMAKY